MKSSLMVVVLVCAFSAAATTVKMEGDVFDAPGNVDQSIYNRAQSLYKPAIHWSDNKAPHSGADYVIPAGYTLGICYTQGEVDFGGDSIDVYGTLSWYVNWGSKLNCTKAITMETGSAWYVNGISSYNYAPFVIKGTYENPVRFYDSADNAEWYASYMCGKIQSDADGCMKVYSTSTGKQYGLKLTFTDADLSEFYGTLRTTGGKTSVYATKLEMPGSFEAVDGGHLMLAGSSSESTFKNLTIDGTSKMTLTASANAHVVNVTNKLVIADGAKLVINKIKAIPTQETPGVYPIFRLSKEAFENPETSIGSPVISPGWSYDELPHGWLCTNLLENGGAEICWTHRQIVMSLKNGGWGASPFKKSVSQVGYLSDGLAMHDCDYYLSHYIYPQTDEGYNNQYICPSPCVIFAGGSQVFWYASDVTISNAVVANSGNVALFRSNDGGDFGYKLRGKLRIVPNATSGVGCEFKNRNGHSNSLYSDISGSGLLKFGYATGFDNDQITRWNCIYGLYGDNRNFKGTMSFTMCANGSCKAAFDDKGLDPFVQGPASNVTVRVNNPYSFGGVLDAFDPAAITVNNENRIEATEDVVFADLNRGWTFTAKGYLRVPTGKTLTLGNRIAIGGTLVKESAGALVLGGSLSATADAEARPVFRVAAGALTLAPTSTVSGVELVCAKGLAPVIEARPSADAAARGVDLSGTKVSAESVQVAWTGLDQLTDDGLQFAVATLDTASTDGSTAAAEFANLLAYTRVPGFKRIVTVADNGDGTSTVRCSLEKRGLLLLVR